MSLILIIIGVLFSLYGFEVLATIGTGHWFNFAFIAIGIVLTAAGILWKKIIKIKRPVKAVLLCIIAGALIFLTVCEIKIIGFGHSTPSDNADYVIILGARVKGNNISREFSERIKAGAEYAAENKDCIIITTGGKGDGENIAEGDAAREMLISLGIDDERIIAENTSTSTEENLENVKALILQEKQSAETGNAEGKDILTDNIVIVSSRFHLYRTNYYAKKLGYENTSYLGVNGLFMLLPHYYLREFCAMCKEWFL